MVVQGIIVIVVFVCLAAGALILQSRSVRGAKREPDDGDAMGHAASVVTSLWLMALALGVILSWQTYDNAKHNTYAEAEGLVELYWDTHQLPQPVSGQLQAGIRDYTKSIVDLDWPLMARGRLSDTANSRLTALRTELAAIRPRDTGEVNLVEDATNRLRDVFHARRQRAVDVTEGLPTGLVELLILTAVLVAALPLIAQLRIGRAGIIPTLLKVALVAMAVFITFKLGDGFNGTLHVRPEAFSGALEQYTQIP